VDPFLDLIDFSFKNGEMMLRSPVARKRSNADSGEVGSADKAKTKGVEAADESLAHGMRRSRGPRDLATLRSSFQQDKHAAETLCANGAGAYLGTGGRVRVDPQAAWRSCHKRAADASKSSWADYADWKQTQHVEICTKTGAILSITWGFSNAEKRSPLSDRVSQPTEASFP